MKKYVILNLIFLLVFYSCTQIEIPVEQIRLNNNYLSMTKGQEATLEVSFFPENATNTEVIWESTNNEVCTVNAGKILAINGGECEIIAKCGIIEDKCLVSVRVPAKSVVLSKNDVEIKIGESIELTLSIDPLDYTDAVVWESSDKSIATCSTKGIVKAIQQGMTKITAKVGQVESYCYVMVIGNIKKPKAIDLGLSVKWADINIGASTREVPGYYYAWGEVETKWLFPNKTYKWYKWDDYRITYIKYSQDEMTVLEDEDDVAHKLLGEGWRMPTLAEFEELLSTKNNPDYTWRLTHGGPWEILQIKYNKNGNTIWLPAAGLRDYRDYYGYRSTGHYWTTSLSSTSDSKAYCFTFFAVLYIEDTIVIGASIDEDLRAYGLQIRPVCSY